MVTTTMTVTLNNTLNYRNNELYWTPNPSPFVRLLDILMVHYSASPLDWWCNSLI